MAKTKRNCFICNFVQVAPADPKFISGNSRRPAKDLFILLQRALELPQIRSDESELVHQISFCNSCLDELERTKNVLDAIDNLKKAADSHKKEIQSKFLTSKVQVQEGNGKSSKNLEVDGVIELRTELVAELKLRSIAAMTDSSEIQPDFLTGPFIKSKSVKESQLPYFRISSSSVVSLGIRNDDLSRLRLKEKYGFMSTSNGPTATTSCDLQSNSEQGPRPPHAPAPTTNSSLGAFQLPHLEFLTDPSNNPEAIKRGTPTTKKTDHLPGPSSKSKTDKASNVPEPRINSSPVASRRSEKDDLSKLNPEGVVQTTSNDSNTSADLHSEQAQPPRLTKPSRSGTETRKKKVSKEFCPRNPQISSEEKKPRRITAVLKNKLQRASPSRTNEKKHKCKQCSSKFAYNSYLVRHVRTHNREKPFRCKLCPKTFSQSSILNRHQLVHSGAKPHLCNFCLKSFAQSCHLVGHMRSHTGEKPYKCNICSKEFAHYSSFNYHKKTHNPAE